MTSTAVRYKFDVPVLFLSIFHLILLYNPRRFRETFILHYIYLKAVVPGYIADKDSIYKTYNGLLKMRHYDKLIYPAVYKVW